ncbi:MAG TPA: 30S ribosomal protein S16 [Acidimicrobiales bacterium]|nr:30S ribosomal protein S16 [Acidimicrobiales bacterium]
MAVKLRLMRMGKKKQPTYRVVAADSRSPRDGRFIEIVGVYDPRPDPSAIRIDNDKAVDWLRKGAQPTESVRKLLEISGAWETFSGEAPSRPAPEPAAAPAGKASASKAPAKSAAKKSADATAGVPAEAEPDASADESAADDSADATADESAAADDSADAGADVTAEDDG